MSNESIVGRRRDGMDGVLFGSGDRVHRRRAACHLGSVITVDRKRRVSPSAAIARSSVLFRDAMDDVTISPLSSRTRSDG